MNTGISSLVRFLLCATLCGTGAQAAPKPGYPGGGGQGQFQGPYRFNTINNLCAQLQDKNSTPEAVTAALDQLMPCLEQKDGINHITLSRIIHGLGTQVQKGRAYQEVIGHYWAEDAQFRKWWLSLAQPQMPSFNPQHLSNTIWALATLKQEMPQPLYEAWVERAKNQMPSFNPQHLSNTIWALATLRQEMPKDLYKAWVERAKNQMPSFNPQDLANSFFAHALLGHIPPPELTQEIAKKWKACTPPQQHSLYQTCLRFKTDETVRKSLEHFAKAFKAQAKPEDIETFQPTTQLEWDISQALKATLPGITIETEHWLTDLCRPADFYLPSQNDTPSKGLVIEADGPSHYIKDAKGNLLRLDGQTALRNWLTQDGGYQLVTIPYHQWDALKDKEAKQDYLRKRLGDVAEVPAEMALSKTPPGLEEPMPKQATPAPSEDDGGEWTTVGKKGRRSRQHIYGDTTVA